MYSIRQNSEKKCTRDENNVFDTKKKNQNEKNVLDTKKLRNIVK